MVETILEEAQRIIVGARNTTHGNKERSFDAIARLWDAYLRSRKEWRSPVSPTDVAYMMVLMKIARSQHGEPVRDHFVDMAGYVAIAHELNSVLQTSQEG